jgi:hypothetical protein
MVANIPTASAAWIYGDGDDGDVVYHNGDIMIAGSYRNVTVEDGATVTVFNATIGTNMPAVILCTESFTVNGIIDLSGESAVNRHEIGFSIGQKYSAPGSQTLGFDDGTYGGYLGLTTLLDADVTDTVGTSITVLDNVSIPTPQSSLLIRVDSELMLWTAKGSTFVWTVTRGYGGSTAATHSTGAQVYTAQHFSDPEVLVNFLGSGSGGNGVTAIGGYGAPGSTKVSALRQPARLLTGALPFRLGAGGGGGDGTNYGGASGQGGNYFVVCAPRILLGPSHEFNIQGGDGAPGGDDGTGATGNGDCGGGGGGASGWLMAIYDLWGDVAPNVVGTGGTGGVGCGTGTNGTDGETGRGVYLSRN